MGVPRRTLARALVCLLAAQALLLAACGTHERRERYEQTAPSTPPSPSASDTTSAPHTTSAPPASQPAPAPSSAARGEPAVMDVLRTADTIAIRSARLARTRSTNDAVRAYAVQILGDQTAASAQLSRLGQRMGVQPRSDPTSRELTSDADQARARFETKRGSDFDRAYLDNEIHFHQRLLELIDQSLVPAVADSEMKLYLANQRSTLGAQLDHAQHVQAALSP
jgi:putative membrane protein